MDEKTTDIIKQTIEKILAQMGFTSSVSATKVAEQEVIFAITTQNDDSHLLIGQYGVNLQALQHLARLIVRKQLPEKIHFSLDVNDYRLQKNQSILEMAQQAAREAIEKNQAVTMRPMSTYERRLVHLELLKNSAVSTESVGEGEDRKLVVKPTDMFA